MPARVLSRSGEPCGRTMDTSAVYRKHRCPLSAIVGRECWCRRATVARGAREWCLSDGSGASVRGGIRKINLRSPPLFSPRDEMKKLKRQSISSSTKNTRCVSCMMNRRKTPCKKKKNDCPSLEKWWQWCRKTAHTVHSLFSLVYIVYLLLCTRFTFVPFSRRSSDAARVNCFRQNFIALLATNFTIKNLFEGSRYVWFLIDFFCEL